MSRRTKKERSKAGRIIRKILLGFLALFLIALLAGWIWFYNAYGREFLALRSEASVIAAGSTREDFQLGGTTIVYYADGSVMQKLAGGHSTYYLKYEDIPEYALNAVLAVEDRKFFTHNGYDIYAIARAARAYIENDGEIRQGGSTITQQLARMIYLTNEKTVSRKVKEIFLAARLERKYTKYDILEFYMNNIYFANSYYGLQAAAKGYFGKTAGDLSLSQLAFLCGIPNSPSDYDPRVRFENTLERRDSVLKQMYENGYISEEEYSKALSETITLVTATGEYNNYEETYTYDCAVRALMKAEGFQFRYAFTGDADRADYEEQYQAEYNRVKRNLYSKGYRIYTSINKTKQEQLQKAIDDELAEYTETYGEGVYALQSAGACIDNETGFAVAIVGGRSQEYTGYTLNRAYQSPRQPGSSIKPLIVYTPAFESGYWPETIVVDERFSGGPRNSEGVYSGAIPLRYAVEVSKNTVAWKLFSELGIERGLGYIQRMEFSHIVSSDFVPAAALGGLTYGTTAVEMASGYAAIENKGIFRSPTCVARITDAFGQDIVNNTTTVTLAAHTVESKRVYEKNASLIMTDVLKGVMTSGTGRKLKLDGHISAGKTGTTNDQKDGWFVGFTPYYTTSIWVGYDMPRKLDELMGNTYPGRIWNSFMQTIHESLPNMDFEEYTDLRPIEDRYPYGWVDNDGDGIPDGYPYGWVDNDGDGIPDGYPEGWIDYDGDGVPDGYPYGWADTDGDGIPDGYPYGWIDTDGDGVADFLNTDNGKIDTNGDGVADSYPFGWIDTDEDGIPDAYPYGWADNDGDGVPDGYPPGLEDADGDGIPDIYESGDGGIWVRPGDDFTGGTEDGVWTRPGDELPAGGEDGSVWTDGEDGITDDVWTDGRDNEAWVSPGENDTVWTDGTGGDDVWTRRDDGIWDGGEGDAVWISP